MTGFIVNVFSFRNRVCSKEAFEGLELGEGKPSRPVLRGPRGRKAAWLLGSSDGWTWWSYNYLAPRDGLLTNGKRPLSISGWTNTNLGTIRGTIRSDIRYLVVSKDVR